MDQIRVEDTDGVGRERLGVLIQAGLLAGPFMSMIDSSVVNVALPDMAAALHSSLAIVQWVASAYLLALGVALAGTAYLARRFGTKSVYLSSLIGFSICSVFCAGSPTIGMLIFARVAQGVFGAPLVPLAMNMLLGKGKAGNQMSALAGVILFLAPAVGPAIGGLLIHIAGWPLIFLINVPVGAVAVLGALRLPDALAGRKEEHAPFDALGFCLLAAAVTGISYGASRGPQFGWLSPSVWPYGLAGIISMAMYVWWERHHAYPIVEISLVWRAQRLLSLTLVALVSVVTFAVIFLTPAFMQDIQGKSSLVAGVALLPQGLITGIGAVLGNILPAKWGIRTTAVLGMGLLTCSTIGLLLVHATSSPWLIAGILCGRGFAIGLVVQPLLNGLIDALPAAKVPDGNTLFNVIERISGTVGIALIITFFQSREQFRITTVLAHLGLANRLPDFRQGMSLTGMPAAFQDRLMRAAVAGFHDVIWLVVGISIAGVILALFITEERYTCGVK